jgi:hypothetical protein
METSGTPPRFTTDNLDLAAWLITTFPEYAEDCHLLGHAGERRRLLSLPVGAAQDAELFLSGQAVAHDARTLMDTLRKLRIVVTVAPSHQIRGPRR